MYCSTTDSLPIPLFLATEETRSPPVLWRIRALAHLTNGGILLTDEGYRGEDLFDWLCDEAQVLRVMPSDDPGEGHSAIS